MRNIICMPLFVYVTTIQTENLIAEALSEKIQLAVFTLTLVKVTKLGMEVWTSKGVIVIHCLKDIILIVSKKKSTVFLGHDQLDSWLQGGWTLIITQTEMIFNESKTVKWFNCWIKYQKHKLCVTIMNGYIWFGPKLLFTGEVPLT